MRKRGWTKFKAYHPLAKILETLAVWAMLIYVLLILAQGVFTYFQMSSLRGEFMAGAEQASCSRITWEEGFDCGGYYSTIVEKRNELLSSNGCGLLGSWRLDTGKPDGFSAYFSFPVCYKPFPFGIIIEVSGGSIFDSP